MSERKDPNHYCISAVHAMEPSSPAAGAGTAEELAEAILADPGFCRNTNEIYRVAAAVTASRVAVEMLGAAEPELRAQEDDLIRDRTLEWCAKVAEEHGETVGEGCWNHENTADADMTCSQRIAKDIRAALSDEALLAAKVAVEMLGAAEPDRHYVAALLEQRFAHESYHEWQESHNYTDPSTEREAIMLRIKESDHEVVVARTRHESAIVNAALRRTT